MGGGNEIEGAPGVGEVISLAAHREARVHGRAGGTRAHRGDRRQVTFYFDLSWPGTYLAAERVDRLFPGAAWRPALADALYAGNPLAAAGAWEDARAAAAERARALRMPLVWPERFPATGRAAMRVAVVAAEQGRAAPFVLAASRLAFCGGFDLDDPEVLAEAAAAACVSLDDCLSAAGEYARDGELEATGLRLLALGATQLPALRVGRALFCGEERIAEAATAWRGAAVPLRSAPSSG
jgi:2-hydroxychromene-2-carboxylate isomerase